MLLPKYIQKKTIVPEVYTVDLISISEPLATPPSPPAPPQPAVTIQNLKEVAAPKTAAIAPVSPETVPSEPAQAISIKPLKRKIKNKKSPDLLAQQARKQRELEQRALKARQQELLAEAKRQQAIADAEARAAASEAVNALKQMLLADALASSAQSRQRTNSGRSGSNANPIESQYQLHIAGRLHQFWALPDIKPWNPDLIARVVIHIAKDGKILSHSFEKRSGDRVFDKFVSRTIQDANPLPPIPGALKKNQYTVGLRFKPGEIL